MDVGAKYIVDCVENFTVILCSDAMGCCVGDVFVLDNVAEILRIEFQPKNSSGGGSRGSRPTKNGGSSAEEREKLQRSRLISDFMC